MTDFKFLHTADWHVGANRSFPDYLGRQTKMIDGIFLIGKKLNCKTVLVVGDIYDRVDLYEEERNLVLNRFAYWLNQGFTIVAVNGNHDFYTEDTTLIQPLIAMSKLNKNLKIVAGNPGLVQLPGFSICAIPCQQNLTKNGIKKIVHTMYSSIEEKPKHFVVMLHEALSGSINDAGFTFEGTEIPDLEYVDYWALGDIHKRQKMGPKAWYPGNPIQIKFDEKPDKGILYFDNGRLKAIPIPGVPKLMTIKQGEEVPQDYIVKYIQTNPLDNETLPKNVVKTVLQIPESKKVQIKNLTKITAGLREFLADRGFSEDQQEKGCHIVELLEQKATDVEEE